MRCGAELEIIKKEDYVYPDIEEDGYSGSVGEYRCPVCGSYYSVSAPDEESRQNYPKYNEELRENFGDSHHGYDGFCPECGHHIIWSGDFMRSEVWGDTETLDEKGNPIVDEYGCDVDDSLVAYVSCPYCGAYIEIVDAKPSELEKIAHQLYEKYKKDDGTYDLSNAPENELNVMYNLLNSDDTIKIKDL